ncbi:cytochrome b [Pikeienuella piscinae]|uniref:Cytochrome b n=1 Tax=Pikeienuella piscinae TaxID=2748098 RepID=A0A7L5BTK9_9RHOB|nr:cytochrome b [Pikeienuella piscinae]QIE55400.1 cytochrome b [Pikeienuella piscinae]
MSLRNTATAWGWPARLLHWAIAALIFFMLGLGFYMAELVSDIYEQFALVQLHKSWGFTVFVLVLIRIVWRLMNRTPDAPPHAGAAERTFARLGHYALYALMLALPLSGWLMASASELQEMYGIRNMVFGLFELPDPFQPGDKTLEEWLRAVHFWCALALTIMLIGHAGAALKHHFIDRDNVLTRMISGR